MLMYGEEAEILMAWLEQYMDGRYLINVETHPDKTPKTITVRDLENTDVKSITFNELMNYEP